MAWASPLAAQTEWSLGPLVGAYRAVGSFEQASIYDTDLPYTPQDLHGSAWGAEARAWFGGRWGAQLQVSSSTSTIGPTVSPEGPTRTRTANVQLATAQALYNSVVHRHSSRKMDETRLPQWAARRNWGGWPAP
ncbi:MAG: hypothetical protein ACYCVL_12830 [Gemmatimonadaceae bacterium]